MSQLYLVKDKKGRIFGPWTEEEICFHIEEGELKGNELFSDYPAGKWQALSASPVFYKKIISKLHSDTKSSYTKEERESLSEPLTNEEHETLEPTRILKVDEKQSSPQKKKVKIKLSREFREEVLEEEGFEDVIDMEPGGKPVRPFQRFFRYGLFAGAGLVLILLLMFLPAGEKSAGLQPERLSAPHATGAKITKEDFRKRFKASLILYKEGSIDSYLKIQKEYSALLSAFPKEVSLYPLLCLVHLELWPFAYQDTKDRQSLQRALNLSQKNDKSKMSFRFCLATHSYINKDFKQAVKMTDYLLGHEKKAISSQFLFYLKAQSLRKLKLEKKALSLLNTVIELDPEWMAPRLSKAGLYYQNQQYSLAIQEYQKILKIYSNHISALVWLGVLQYKQLRQAENSEQTLTKAFSKSPRKTAPDILFAAYMALANIYYNQNKEEELLKYTKKAYALFPSDPDVIKLKNSVKNEKTFSEVKVESRALIYKGAMLMDQGDCLKAVKNFTEAYQFTKSGLAALKAGECYWSLGSAGESIRWLKKAINAEEGLLDASLLLSDYLSRLYQFDYARDVLSSVVRRYPNNPDLFKAYSKVAFRQEYYNQTIAYGGRALNFYPHDVETLVLLSRSHFALEEVHLAYSYAKKAISKNPNDSSAQISYALILDYMGGEEDTEGYLRKMIQKFPTVFEYHQALGEYFYNKEKYEKAREELELLTSKNPKLKEAYMYLGLVYTELGLKNKKYYKQYYDEAVRQFREASLLDLSDVQPFFYVGRIHLNRGNYDLALKEFNKVATANPNYPLIHYYRGLTILNQGSADSLDEALKSAQTEAVKNPNHYLPYKLAGDVYRLKSSQSFSNERERKKIYNLCAKEYQKALKHVKKSIEVSMNLLICYKGAGHLDLALDLANSLTKEEGLSGYPEIYREIGIIFEFKEEYERASSYYETYFQLKPGAKDRAEIERRIAFLIEKKKRLMEPEGGE